MEKCSDRVYLGELRAHPDAPAAFVVSLLSTLPGARSSREGWEQWDGVTGPGLNQQHPQSSSG